MICAKSGIKITFLRFRSRRRKAPAVDLDAAPEPPLADDLENQDLSKNPAERVRQLDLQAQENEERETS